MKIDNGYKMTEVGVIPEDWEVKQLKSMLDKNPTYGINAAAVALTGELPTYIRITDITDEGYFDYTKRVGVNHPLSSNYYLEAGDIVFARTGASVGKSYMYNLNDGKLVYAGFLIKIRPDIGKLLPVYLAQYTKTQMYWNWVNVVSMRSGQPGINGKEYGQLSIPMPPTIEEQKAIATALSDADELIQSLEKLIAKKRAIKQGAMQELLKPKEGWTTKKLGEIFNFSGGYSATREKLVSEGYCYLHYGDIHGSKTTYIDVKEEYSNIPKLPIELKKISRKSMLNDGDVVFVDASEDDEGTSRHIVIKNSSEIPFISGLHTIVAKSKDDSINNEYKRYCFQSIHIKNQFKFYAVGTKVSGISKVSIAKIEIKFPAIEEQTAIASILSDMDAEITALEAKLEKYKKIKHGMMQNLLTGKIRLV